jgi:transposase
VKRKLTELFRNGWILHQDNAPVHNAFSVKQFSANHNFTVLERPPYSPDLAPGDYSLFPKIKLVFKRTHFLSVENVKVKVMAILNSLSENYLQNCFDH